MLTHINLFYLLMLCYCFISDINIELLCIPVDIRSISDERGFPNPATNRLVPLWLLHPIIGSHIRPKLGTC